jgi:hypothetical protein
MIGSSHTASAVVESATTSKRDRKRKSEAKSGAVVSAPVSAAGHSLTRDERKAMTLGLPISVQVAFPGNDRTRTEQNEISRIVMTWAAVVNRVAKSGKIYQLPTKYTKCP